MNLSIDNILKIADIDNVQLSPELVNFLTNDVQHTYADTQLKEHIYNIEDILEGIEGGGYDVTESVEQELTAISELLTQTECGYFRVTF